MDEKVEEDWGDAGALRDSSVDVPIGGGGVVVSAAGHPPAKVGRQPANRVMSECCLREGGNEFGVVDHVESFGKINRHGQCAVRWQGLIEALCHLVYEGKEGSCGGVVWAETVLCWG